MQELTQIQQPGYAETERFDTVQCEHLNFNASDLVSSMHVINCDCFERGSEQVELRAALFLGEPYGCDNTVPGILTLANGTRKRC